MQRLMPHALAFLMFFTTITPQAAGRERTNPLPKEQKNQSDALSVLLEQYKIAVQLYSHEDSLNWQKLNHFLYVTAGLWAIAGFIWNFRPSATSAVLPAKHSIIVVCATGMAACVLFEVAIFNGVKFMYKRKAAVVRIEKHLIEYGAKHLIFSNQRSTSDQQDILIGCLIYPLKQLTEHIMEPMHVEDEGARISLTMLMLISVPFLMFLVWSTMLTGVYIGKFTPPSMRIQTPPSEKPPISDSA